MNENESEREKRIRAETNREGYIYLVLNRLASTNKSIYLDHVAMFPTTIELFISGNQPKIGPLTCVHLLAFANNHRTSFAHVCNSTFCKRRHFVRTNNNLFPIEMLEPMLALALAVVQLQSAFLGELCVYVCSCVFFSADHTHTQCETGRKPSAIR